MTKASWLLSLVLLFCGGARGRTQQPGPIALTHVTVIDMTGAPPKSDMTVVIQTDRIVAVGRSSKTHPPKNARIIDARHKYLIPGLWDMHIHNFFGPNRSFYSLYIANGVTGVRDMGGEWKYYDADEQELRAGRPLNGRWPAPRMVAAGVILDGKPPVHPTDVSVTNAEEARAAVDMCKGHGVDFIKVYNLLNRESYFAIADEAKKDGLPFVGHVPFTVSAADASDAGQKSIEHSDGILLASSTKESELREQLLKELREKGFSFGLYNLTEGAAIESYDRQKANALFARFVKNGTWVCPTLVVEKRLLLDEKSEEVIQLANRYVPHMAQGFWKQSEQMIKSASPEKMAEHKKVYSRYAALVGPMHRAGVPLLAGTDTTNPYLVPGFSLHEELGLLVEAGLTPMEALQTATINPARFLGKDKELGTVEKGKLADLVLLDANPLADIHNTTKIDAVFANGRYLSKKTLQEMLAEVATAAKKPH